VTCQWP